MRIVTFSLASILALSVASARADVSVKISDVHLCCKSCVTGVEKAVGEVSGAKAMADQDGMTVTITAPDNATAQKAADAMVKAGYFGKSAAPEIKLMRGTGAKGEKVKTVTVEGVHLCCPKCVKAVDKAVKTVPGVEGQTATKGAKTFDVTGDFNDQEVLTALEKAGLCGKVK